MAPRATNKKVANSLVALSSAAVFSVYAAGYMRTRSAAERFEQSERHHFAHFAPGGNTIPGAPPDAGRGRGFAPPTSGRLAPDSPLLARGPTARTANDLRDSEGSDRRFTGDQPPINQVRSSQAQIQTIEPPTSQPAGSFSAAPPMPEPASVPVSALIQAIVPQANPPVVATPSPEAPGAAESKWKDGKYYGWGTCRHGDIQAQVVISGGKIVEASVAQCLTRYSCDVIGRLPPEVVARQSAETDFVSGATQSTYAFYYAVLEALDQAAGKAPAK